MWREVVSLAYHGVLTLSLQDYLGLPRRDRLCIRHALNEVIQAGSPSQGESRRLGLG